MQNPIMRDPKRIRPFLEVIAQYWEMNPNMRFMQIISNVQAAVKSDCYYVEDEFMLENFKKYFGLTP